ncbi:MAG: hypothetical protein BWX71_02715 [Deltaproteobacteria bacterium ADurb.Bin072]|nr:MAG: hypothetical protein BWX71_02715 [Deltaproteobacteria bacterium ADurb.Bin072]
MQSKAGYHTAVRVQKARDLDDVVKAVKKEAEYAADNFYYRWPVKDKRTGKTKNVEGGTIGCALSIARNWTNCVITMEVEEHPGYWIFTPSFVDLETGFTVTRSFKKTKPKSAPGNFEQDRWEDVAFQKGQSQAIRNVVFNGVPQWLRNEAIEVAKQAALNHISRDGIVKSRDKAMGFLSGYGITEDRVKAVIGKALNDFTAQDVQTIRNLCQQIQNGDVSADDAFPPIETDQKEDKPKTRTRKTETTEEPPKTNGNGKGKITEADAQEIDKSLSEFQLSVAAFKRAFDIENIVDLPADKMEEARKWINTEVDKLG